jgi:hypothetical protein
MRTLLLASAAALVLSQAAFAQTADNAQNGNANQPAAGQHMRANLRSMLEKSGYKDIRIAPTSFAVHATDSDGNPVMMSISPDSFAEVTDVDSNGGSTTGSAGSGNGSGTFVSVPNNDELSSKVVGLELASIMLPSILRP